MGVDISIILGPYLKIKGDLKKSVIKIKRVCPNHLNIKHNDAKFCPLCGSQIQNEEYTDIEDIGLMQLLDEHGYLDNLVTVEYLEGILIPNQSLPNEIKIDAEVQNEVNLFNVDELKQNQIDWMYKTYHNEINMLKENFGDENVTLTWGLVTYWS